MSLWWICATSLLVAQVAFVVACSIGWWHTSRELRRRTARRP